MQLGGMGGHLGLKNEGRVHQAAGRHTLPKQWAELLGMNSAAVG